MFNGLRAFASAQPLASSAWCISHHSRTSLVARLGERTLDDLTRLDVYLYFLLPVLRLRVGWRIGRYAEVGLTRFGGRVIGFCPLAFC